MIFFFGFVLRFLVESARFGGGFFFGGLGLSGGCTLASRKCSFDVCCYRERKRREVEP